MALNHTNKIAIIIGCWTEHKQHTNFYKHINDVINNDISIQSIVINTQHIDINTIPQLWIDNSNDIFIRNQGVDYVRRMHKNSYNSSNMNMTVYNKFNFKKQVYALNDAWQIEYLINHVLCDISTVSYYGVGFNRGMEYDPIGFDAISDLIKFKHLNNINIYIDTTNVLSNITPKHLRSRGIKLWVFDNPIMTNKWEHIHNTLYRKII